jgi:alpha-D-ribose 1-methylphosphonate 5-triphosphate synthase subunit PhnG
MPNTQPSEAADNDDLVRKRREAMAVLAGCSAAEISGLLAKIAPRPAHEEIRKAESGLVMVRGRIGGDGAPFNVGEATVSRSAVRLATSEVGFGYVLGRDHAKARLIAYCDALLQHGEYRPILERVVLAPMRRRARTARDLKAEQAAATKVEFFTLVRGEG